MLKEKSIQKMQESKNRNKLRSFENHKRKMIEKRNQKIELTRWYRNQGAVVTGMGEERYHKFFKLCCAIALEEAGFDYISEYKLKGLECDIFSPTHNWFIELETNLTESKKTYKLEQFKYIINSTNCDFFIFDISKIPKDLDKAVEYFKEKLGL